MKIERDYNLGKLNTFGIPAKAKLLVEIHSEEELGELLGTPEFKDNEKIFLGGGSNVLFTRDWDGIVVLNKLKGVQILEEDDSSVVIRAMGGEIWHDLVEFVVARGYWGIENLSLIPGSVGAAPMQNIGAYGAELKETLLSVEAYEIATGQKKTFSSKECALGYRDSIFKNTHKGKYFIAAVSLKLNKEGSSNVTYKILRDYLDKNQITVKGPKDISDAVAAIRRSKLPDPKVIGNAGSFFKNVFVSPEKLKELQEKYPEIPHFEEEEIIKIPGGWLIEQAGWRGYREGNVGVHERQALVLVNHGGATGPEILALAHKVISSVEEKFGLKLEPEVNIV
ncbi:MAG: UDP-N-acetylmuramate dehydrogenase [Candidatus Paceibacterota bacterium]|jgi:UDP-N-acetylmuramate dehydrogenase